MPFAVPVSPLATILFMALALVMFAFVVRAARRSSAGEGSSRRNDRSRIGIIIQGVGVGFAGFGPIHGILPALSPVSIAQCLVVLLLMLGAIGLFASSSRALGRNWSLVARTRTDHELVRRGPYARIRHPIYLGLLLFLLALACAFGHWAQLIFALPVYLTGTAMRIRIEDRLLEAEFGDEFRDYARSTPAVIPKLG